MSTIRERQIYITRRAFSALFALSKSRECTSVDALADELLTRALMTEAPEVVQFYERFELEEKQLMDKLKTTTPTNESSNP